VPKINMNMRTPALPDWFDGVLDDVYVPMIEKISAVLADQYGVDAKAPVEIQEAMRQGYIDDVEWTVTVQANSRGAAVNIEGPGVTIRRQIKKDMGFIYHAYFELEPELQGKGIAAHVLESTVKLKNRTGISKVTLNANIDVGGYAWLRKGFFPSDGLDDLLAEARSVARKAQIKPLYDEFEALATKMSKKELRGYFLSDDFRKYKELFLGAMWNGETDLNDPVSETAFTKSAKSAYEMFARGIGAPTTANEKVLDGLVRHQTYLMRYAASLRNGTINALTETEAELRKYLMYFADGMEGLSPTSKEAQKEFKRLEKDIYALRAEAWDEIKADVPEELIAMGTYEAGATLAIIEGAFPVALGLQPLSVDHIKRIVRAQPFEGRTLSEWLSYNQNIDAQRITRAAKAAIVAGQTPTEVARAVMGTKDLNYKDGQARKAFRDAESVYLTVTNGINNQIKADLYAENDDIIDQVLFVATLDVRTTLECAGNDGKVFKQGEAPQPPLHFRCRSLLVPYINPDNLNKRGFDSSTDKGLLDEYASENDLGKVTEYDQLPRGYKTKYNAWARKRKRELVGQVPATQNFDTWLRNQPVEFQNEYLGVGKAEIFRQGKLSLDKFVTRDGYELTIEELKKLSEKA